MISKKSFVIGVGAGILFSSFVTFIAYSFDYKSDAMTLEASTLTEEDVIKNAKKLGMVFIKDTEEVQIVVPVAEQPIQEETIVEPVVEPIAEQPAQIETEDLKIIVEFPKGSASYEIARLLEENGVIDDSDLFNNFLMDNEATKRLKAGSIMFDKNMDYEDILKLIKS